MDNRFDRPDQNRYVAYFDMLGLKTATRRNPAKAWESLKNLQSCMDEVSKLKIHVLDKDIVLVNIVKTIILADSVLIFTHGDSLNDLTAILMLTSELFAKGLHRCVPLRGAITYGEFFYDFDLNLFGGIPFVQAYELEKKAQWSGIVVDNLVAGKYRKTTFPKCPDGSSLVIEWDVPFKKNIKEKMWVLDWVKPHKNNFTITPPISVTDYYSGFINLFGSYNELLPEVQEKYKNTVEFINYSLSNVN